RHRDQKAEEPEQITEGKQREHQPHRMQSYTSANQFWRKHVAFEKLSDEKDREHPDNWHPIRPELRDRYRERNDKAGKRTDVGDEADKPRNESDQEAEA